MSSSIPNSIKFLYASGAFATCSSVFLVTASLYNDGKQLELTYPTTDGSTETANFHCSTDIDGDVTALKNNVAETLVRHGYDRPIVDFEISEHCTIQDPEP